MGGVGGVSHGEMIVGVCAMLFNLEKHAVCEAAGVSVRRLMCR